MSYTVEAVSAAMDLLFLVAQEPGLGVTELAKRSGTTKARAFRLLGTLEESGLVRRKEPYATYSLGYKALFVGTAAQEQVNITHLAKSHLPEIGQRCSESVLIRIRDGLETICVAWWDAPNAIRVHNQMGDRRPMYVGASGKLLLAYAPADVQEQVLSSERERFTANTITKRSQLEKELATIREQGYSVSFAEKVAETISAAAPIRDASGNVIASLSMTAPASRVSKEQLPKYVKLLQAGAEAFSVDLGYVQK